MPRPEFHPHEAYYEYVARGYDETAGRYDYVEGRNFLSERIRHASLEEALRVFPPGARILELGCGTGRDAVTLAHRGLRVVATDISPEMVALTKARAEREDVEDLVSPKVKTAAQAACLDGPFDGAYSNGAVLNLEPDLIAVANGLHQSLGPGSPFVMTAANRLSLFELFTYPLFLRPRKAFRKLQQTVPIPISREGPGSHYVVPTRFYTPPEFLSLFHRLFDLEALRGLQVITPPWNMVDKAMSFYSVIRPLQAIEDRLGRVPGVRSLGAIFLLTLRRKRAT